MEQYNNCAELYGHGGDVYGNPGVKLDFSVNVNPFGLPDTVRETLMYRVNEYTHYPDPLCRKLRNAIARNDGLPEDWVLCGNGAADLIYRLCYAVRPRKALVCAPTFSEYEHALEQVGCHVVRHPLLAENAFTPGADIADAVTPDIDMIFLCHPNNPTGRLFPEYLMAPILDAARQNRAIVVVDECFLDFTDGISFKRYLKEMPGLVILKAFTKIYAMAGLRLGYLLTADKTLMDKVRVAAQCWSVSVPAQIAGATALSCTGWIERTKALIRAERTYMTKGLSALGIEVFPSDANYLLLRSARPLYGPLLEKGILIRACANFKGLDENYFRIGLKTRAKNELFMQVVKEYFNG